MDEFMGAAPVEACMVDGMSIREASRVFGLHRDTMRKMLEYSVPPGYRWRKPPRRPKIGPYTPVIDRILEDDLNLPWKQRYIPPSASTTDRETSTTSTAATVPARASGQTQRF